MSRWALLAGAIVAEVAGSLALKAGTAQPAWYAFTAAGYLIAFGLMSRLLARGMPLGVAYGIWGAVGVALTAALSAVLFGEPLTTTMLVGMTLIILGVLAIELGGQRAARRREHGA